MKYLAFLIFALVGCSDDPVLAPSTPPNNDNNEPVQDMGMPDQTDPDSDVFPDPDPDPILDGTPLPDERDYTGELPERPETEVSAALYDIGVAYCERMIECRTTAETVRFATGKGITNVGLCVEAFMARHAAPHYESSVADGVTFNATAVAACQTALGQYSCTELLPAWEAPDNFVTTCQDVFAGTGAQGTTCGSTADCAASHYCDRSLANGCLGQCEPIIDFRSICSGTPCAEGQICNESGQCSDPPGQGQPCGVEDICATNLFCDNDSICQPMTLGFQAGQACDYSTNVCAMGLVCVFDQSGRSACIEPTDDGACLLDELPSACIATAHCVENDCKAKRDAGACSYDEECTSGWCVNGTCVDPTETCP